MDAVGNMLLLDITMSNIKIRHLNNYSPNTDELYFCRDENIFKQT